MAGKKGPSGLPISVRAEAVQMLADGYSEAQIAERYGVTDRTIREWKKNPVIIEECRKATLKKIVPAYSKALEVMLRQLDSDMPWIQQGAARDILTRYHELVTGQSNRDIVITLAGAPVLGMPDSAAVSDTGANYIDSTTDDA